MPGKEPHRYPIAMAELPAEAVIRAVAIREHASPGELRAPVYDELDHDALDVLFDRYPGEPTVQLEYHGWDIELGKHAGILK